MSFSWDRYRPRRRHRHGMSTPEPMMTSSTRPTTWILPRNTVIPLWRAPIKHGSDHSSFHHQDSDHAQELNLGLASTPSFLGTFRQSPGKNDSPLTSTVPSQEIQTSFTLTTTTSTSSHIPDNFKMPEAKVWSGKSSNLKDGFTIYSVQPWEFITLYVSLVLRLPIRNCLVRKLLFLLQHQRPYPFKGFN